MKSELIQSDAKSAFAPRRDGGKREASWDDRCRIRLMVGLLSVLAMGSTGWADGVVALDTALPPPGKYVSPVEFHAYAALGIILDDPSHFGFTNVEIEVDGDDEIETFDSAFSATEIGDFNLGLVTLTGPVQVRTSDIAGSSTRTGTFDTEIIAMSLTGAVDTPLGFFGIQVRIDPNRPSIGETTITDIGGGQFQIDSFFDVFTEISVDFGEVEAFGPFFPSDGSTRMTLVVPEPSTTLALLGVGALSLVRRRRWRHAA